MGCTPAGSASSPTPSRTGDRRNDSFRVNYFCLILRDHRGLTWWPLAPISETSVGRTAAPARAERPLGEESPGSIDMRCRITSGGGNPRESATESEPPVVAAQVEMASKGEKV